jgi:hypothetical protein
MYNGRLDLLDRDLHLSAAWSDPGGRVLCKPTDNLRSGAILGGVVSLCDLGMQRRGDGPGLGPVDADFGEPDCLVVGSEPALDGAGLDVVPGHPPLVRRTIHVFASLDCARRSNETLRQATPLGQVVVVGPGPVGLDVVARGRGTAAVDLQPTMHPRRPHRQPSTPVNPQINSRSSTYPSRKFVACVPLIGQSSTAMQPCVFRTRQRPSTSTGSEERLGQRLKLARRRRWSCASRG